LDFKDFDVVRGRSLERLPLHHELSKLHVAKQEDDGKEVGAIRSYVERISDSRQALLADTRKALTLTSQPAGSMIVKMIGDEVISRIETNTVLSDGVALFDTATHGNLASSGATPAAATIEAGYEAIGSQTDGLSQNLNLLLTFILGRQQRYRRRPLRSLRHRTRAAY
jgi:hypothetical protein